VRRFSNNDLVLMETTSFVKNTELKNCRIQNVMFPLLSNCNTKTAKLNTPFIEPPTICIQYHSKQNLPKPNTV
jgi:hypothetical protein